MPNRSTTAVYCSAILALAACSTTTTQSFRVAESSNVEVAFIATDADFSKYHQLLAKDMGIFFPQNVKMSDEDLARLRQTFSREDGGNVFARACTWVHYLRSV